MLPPCHQKATQGGIEAVIGGPAKSQKRGVVISEECRHQRGTGAVPVFGDAPSQRGCIKRRRHNELLPRNVAQSDLDGDLGQAIEPAPDD
jgi:hypothetical protein